MNKYENRKYLIIALIILLSVFYLARLFHIQVIDRSYEAQAVRNACRNVVEYPARGLIYDRNNRLLVGNQAAYDLMFVPRQVHTFDTSALISALGISREGLEREIARSKKFSTYQPSVLVSQITGERYARLQEILFRYPGFYIQTRTLRSYNVPHSADVFGYVAEVTPERLAIDPSYQQGDAIGITGIEMSHEAHLRGKKGLQVLVVDNHGNVQGPYQNGALDRPSEVGENLQTTLDYELQDYAYRLMKNKKGAIVAIEPKTGEILAKVSAPGYDPSLMVGLDRTLHFQELERDTLSPLFDRATMAQYSPGSIFKVVQGAIALETRTMPLDYEVACDEGADLGAGVHMGCHRHASPLTFVPALQNSCNPYFATLFMRVLRDPAYSSVRDAYGAWRTRVLSFGLGHKLSIDFDSEKSGLVPDQAYYDRVIGTKRWHPLNIISLAIGQGELLVTPLQLANLSAAVANRGYYITPHIVRPYDEEGERRITRHRVEIDSTCFGPVIEGMERAIRTGTGSRAAIRGIRVAGKTGTVQNPHGADHSVFIAFAPVEDPRIAIAVYIENGEWGSSYAAPIAGLLMEQYLTGAISPQKEAMEQRMINANLLSNGTPTPARHD